MHDHHSTFEIKGFYLYAVNTVSFTSFQWQVWQHNGSRQRHGERQLCESKKYCSSSLQLPCTLLVTGFYSRFGQRKRRSVGECLSTSQTERVSQGQATKEVRPSEGPTHATSKIRSSCHAGVLAKQQQFAALNNFREIWISTFSKGVFASFGWLRAERNENEVTGVRNWSSKWSEKFRGVRKSISWVLMERFKMK